MALFGKQRRRFLDVPEINSGDARTTVIDQGFHLEGVLQTGGDAIVRGRIDGDLAVAGRLVLLREARVAGRVFAEAAKIEGEVDGPVEVASKLEVGPTAKISGDLAARTLAIAEGASVHGGLTSASEPVRFTERRHGDEESPSGDSVTS